MKRYYRNWYQHYLELEAEKNREIQRGYYSNLAPSKGEHNKEGYREKSAELSTQAPIQEVAEKKKAKRGLRVLDLLLPFLMICAFVVTWYKLDIGPVRQFVHESLVWVGVREETVDVISYHVSLLDQHLAFADAVANFITGDTELSFADLDLLYDAIRLRYDEVIEVSTEVHAEAVRLWGFKVASAQQMMNNLLINDDVTSDHAQFLNDQAEIAALIRDELRFGE